MIFGEVCFDQGFIHGDCLTVTGKTMAENLQDIVFNEKSRCSLSSK